MKRKMIKQDCRKVKPKQGDEAMKKNQITEAGARSHHSSCLPNASLRRHRMGNAGRSDKMIKLELERLSCWSTLEGEGTDLHLRAKKGCTQLTVHNENKGIFTRSYIHLKTGKAIYI